MVVTGKCIWEISDNMKSFAFYLPQFYPVPENDKYWGKGFTEWRNVANAKPLFRGHEQPRIPTDFGFYDLRNVETMQSQIEYAKQIGIGGFSFWHYWFGNDKRALEKPAEIFLNNPELDIKIFFSWVNYNWTKSWIGKDDEIIFHQKYDEEDYKKHFDYLLPFFNDKRYAKVNNKPIFSILKPGFIPGRKFYDMFEDLALENGLDGISWFAPLCTTPQELICKFDFLYGFPPGDAWVLPKRLERIYSKLGLASGPRKIDYRTMQKACLKYASSSYEKLGDKFVPTFLPNWDNTPRYLKKGFLYANENLKNIELSLKELFSLAKENSSIFFFFKSWNEWAEGNYIEPDILHGNKIGSIIASIIK